MPAQCWHNVHTNKVAVVAKTEAMHGLPMTGTPSYKAALNTADSKYLTCSKRYQC